MFGVGYIYCVVVVEGIANGYFKYQELNSP